MAATVATSGVDMPDPSRLASMPWAMTLQKYIEDEDRHDAAPGKPSRLSLGPIKGGIGSGGVGRFSMPGKAGKLERRPSGVPPMSPDLRATDSPSHSLGPGYSDAGDSQNLEEQVLRHLQNIMDNRAANKSSNGQASGIPVFFRKKPSPASLSSRLQHAAKLKFLQQQKESLLDQQELEVLWTCLRDNRTVPDDESGSERINYDDFLKVSAICLEKVGPKSQRFFTAATFLTFEADDSGRIAILPFYLYIMRWVSITQTRIDMCMLDKDGDGYLNSEEMEAYIRGLLPHLKLLAGLPSDFEELYCRIAVRKFLFFCDPQKRGKLLIREVLLSPVLSELMELRQEVEGEDQALTLADNWFALPSATRIHQMFLALDTDSSGGLSKDELKPFNDNNLTDIFIERVFDEHVRKGRGRLCPPGEMDLCSFLDLVLALDNKHTPEGLAYIFKCLDLNERGYLTTADVYTLFRSVHRRWMEGGNYELMIEDVKDEVWDMVRPQDPLRITLEDLVECKQGDTVCSMLIDIGGFWAHDNRENLAAQQDAE